MDPEQDPSQLRITMFGGLRLECGGRPLPSFSTQKVRALFAYLATFRDRHHPRAVLASLLWPNLPEERARRYLSDALWRLRRVVGDDSILADEDALAFNGDGNYWLDVEKFEQKVASSKGQEISCNLQLAIELYRGEFLEGFYDDWALRERERLHLEYLEALERLLLWHRDQGEYAQALEYGLRLTAADPLRDSAHRQVMLLYQRLGQHHAALQQFETCRHILRDELDAEPLPETMRLAQEIRESTAPARTPFDDFGRAPLVGRQPERANLLARLDAAVAGRGGLVLIEGEPGVGKTRLTEEAATGAEWRGFQVLSGICRDEPFAPLVEALEQGLTPLRAGQLARLVEPTLLAALVPLIPVLADLLSLPDLPPLEPSEEKIRLHRALVRCLVALGQITPHALVVEDWQWMDPATLEILPLLAEHLPGSRVLLIGTARSGELRDRPDLWEQVLAIDRGGALEHLRLKRLTTAEADDLLCGLLGTSQPALGLSERIYTSAQGNPFYITEWIKALVESGQLSRGATGAWVFSADESWQPPAVVLRVIAARLERLLPEERRLLDGAAVLGDPFDFDLWSAATGAGDKVLLTSSDELLRRQFIVETPSGYRFTHDLIRQVAYDLIDPETRRRWHRQAGLAVEALHPQAVNALAWHFSCGDTWEKAWQYAEQAGERAADVHAHEQAVTHFTRALDALRHARDEGQAWAASALDIQARLFQARESALGLLGRQEERRSDIEALFGLARDLDDAQMLSSAYRKLAFFYVETGEHAQARDVALEALRLAESTGDLEGQAHLHGALGAAWYVLEDYARSFEHYQTASGFFEQAGNRDGVGRMLAGMSLAGMHSGRNLEALRYGEQALQIHREMGNRTGQMVALRFLGLLYGYGGLFRLALAYRQETVDLSREIGSRIDIAIGLRELAVMLRETGAFEEAAQCLEESLAITGETGARRGQGMALVTMGDLRFCQERYDEALTFHQEALALNREVGLKHMMFRSHWTLSRVYQAMGERELLALDHAREALRVAREADVNSDVTYARSNLAQVLLAMGKKAEALKHTTASIALFEKEGYLEEAEEEVLFSHSRVLQALEREAEGAGYLRWAFERMTQKAQELDGEARVRFLERLPLNRAIAAEYARRQGLQPGQCRFSLAADSASAGKQVEVAWTLDAGEPDAELLASEGKVTLRRARLLRLLEEAREQGATPTQDDLARALGVTRRTIRSDLVALRRQGFQVETWGMKT